jgi:hypothetical protein
VSATSLYQNRSSCEPHVQPITTFRVQRTIAVLKLHRGIELNINCAIFGDQQSLQRLYQQRDKPWKQNATTPNTRAPTFRLSFHHTIKAGMEVEDLARPTASMSLLVHMPRICEHRAHMPPNYLPLCDPSFFARAPRHSGWVAMLVSQ